MKAAILLRVSTEEQSERKISIPAQKSRNLAYCEAKNWEVYDYYVDDGYSGKDLDRPAIQRLIADAQAKKFDVVLVWKLDRLSRRQQHVMYLIEDIFLANGIEFASVTENIDTSTAMGRAMIGIMAVFAQLERETIIERTKMGKEEAARQGRYFGGPKLFGYRNDPTAKVLSTDPAEAAVVRFIYSEYLKGDRGYQAIADTLNRLAIPSPGGKPRWHAMTIRRALENPVYAGYIRHRERIYPGRHEPIITELEFKQAQSFMATNRGRFGPNGDNCEKGLLRGILFCGECGARLRFKSAGIRNGAPRLFYVCYSVDRRAPHMVVDKNCPAKYLSAAKLEQKVINELLGFSPDPSRLQAEIDDTLKNQRDEQEWLCADSQIQKQLVDTGRLIKKWQDAFESDLLPLNEFSDHLKNLQSKKLELENRLREIRHTAATCQIASSEPQEIIEELKDFSGIWAIADYNDRRRLILSCIRRVEVDRNENINILWL